MHVRFEGTHRIQPHICRELFVLFVRERQQVRSGDRGRLGDVYGGGDDDDRCWQHYVPGERYLEGNRVVHLLRKGNEGFIQ